MACKHSIVTNQKSALPPGAMMARQDMQKCCVCGQVRTQEWGQWREPIHVEEVAMAEYAGKTEKQKEAK